MSGSTSICTRGKPGIRACAWHLLKRAWNPKPVDPPAADPQLSDYPFLTRSAEVLKYQMLQVEYSLSRGGGLRAWFKMNLIFAIVLAIPTVFTVPVVTLLLYGMSSWAFLVYRIVRNLTLTLLWGIFLVIIAGTLVYFVGQWRSGDDDE